MLVGFLVGVRVVPPRAFRDSVSRPPHTDGVKVGRTSTRAGDHISHRLRVHGYKGAGGEGQGCTMEEGTLRWRMGIKKGEGRRRGEGGLGG